MTASTDDFLEKYLDGLTILLNSIDRNHNQYLDVLTFQQRLAENIYTVRLFGDTETLREIRSEIIARLNALTLSVLHISFNELCGIGNRYKPVFQQDRIVKWSSVSKGLSQTAWPRFLEIDADYQERRNQLLQTILNGDYDQANQQYWNILYYTGTRELWTDRAFLSQRLLELSDKKKDYRTSGLILARGQAWPLLHRGKFQGAKRSLQKALESFIIAGARSEIGIFYEYMGDINSEVGDVDQANDFYLEARSKLQEDDAHKVELKRLFTLARYEDLGSRIRIDSLVRLQEDFGLIKSYKEGIVQIELAKSYYFLKAPEAMLVAEEAYNLLKNDVIMPSRAARAKRVVNIIRSGEPIISHP